MFRGERHERDDAEPESPEDAPLDWDEPAPFQYWPLAEQFDDDSWRALEWSYSREADRTYESVARDTDRPLHECLKVAHSGGATAAVVETRYIDRDYRSEYSALYSRAFESYPDTSHRIHFFGTRPNPKRLWKLSKKDRSSYVGYMVIRPRVLSIVGRTMLRPPTELRGHVRTGVTDSVTFFGQRLTVRGVPFMQQDARLGTCSHVASWMCHYSAALGRSDVAPRAIADFSHLANPSLQVGRPVPSPGLSDHQLSDLLREVGLPPLFYNVDALSDGDRIEEWPDRRRGRNAQATRVCCRYLNSGLPVILLTSPSTGRRGDMHSMVACGYRRINATDDGVQLIAHDDRRGPYRLLDSCLVDEDDVAEVTLTTEQIVAPLPRKLWLPGEAVERLGSQLLLSSAREAQDAYPKASLLLDLHEKSELTLRTYAIDSGRFKERLAKHCKDDRIVEEISYLRLPRYIWVVEAIDRPRRDRGRDPEVVVGHVIFDATSDEQEPRVLSTRVPGVLSVYDIPGSIAVRSSHLRTAGQYSP